MKTTIALSAAALLALTVPAFAKAHDQEVQTKSGKTVWSLGANVPGGGVNNGGKGKTEKAAGGLVNAVGKGGLNLVDVDKGE